jgi:hypothetical protein
LYVNQYILIFVYWTNMYACTALIACAFGLQRKYCYVGPFLYWWLRKMCSHCSWHMMKCTRISWIIASFTLIAITDSTAYWRYLSILTLGLWFQSILSTLAWYDCRFKHLKLLSIKITRPETDETLGPGLTQMWRGLIDY